MFCAVCLLLDFVSAKFYYSFRIRQQSVCMRAIVLSSSACIRFNANRRRNFHSRTANVSQAVVARIDSEPHEMYLLHTETEAPRKLSVFVASCICTSIVCCRRRSCQFYYE